MIQVTISEAQARLPELLSSVEAGEPVSIRSDDGRIYHLSAQAAPPLLNPKWPGYPRAGSCEGLFVVPDDFKEPLDELREYME